MVYEQPRICPGEWDAQTPQGFWHTSGSPNLGQTTRSYIKQKKKRELSELWISCPNGPQCKIERMGKMDKYFDLTTDWKKLWNMKVTIIAIVIGVLVTVSQGLVEGQEDLEITDGWMLSKLQHFLDRSELWEASWRFEETSCHQRIDTSNGGVENNRTSGDHSNYGIIEISQNTG